MIGSGGSRGWGFPQLESLAFSVRADEERPNETFSENEEFEAVEGKVTDP